MSDNLSKNLDLISERIGYRFKDNDLLLNALTHSSYCFEHDLRYRYNNERLEFLGDAVFDAIIADELYKRLSENEEGDLSRLRSEIVCEKSLKRKASELGLYGFMRLGRGEEQYAAGGKKSSLSADAMEAVIGAIYLDGGWECVRSVILKLFGDVTDDALNGRLRNDYKSALQEKLQATGRCSLKYRVDAEEGPAHDRRFTVTVMNEGVEIGQGTGTSKKLAEQDAARAALQSE